MPDRVLGVLGLVAAIVGMASALKAWRATGEAERGAWSARSLVGFALSVACAVAQRLL